MSDHTTPIYSERCSCGAEIRIPSFGSPVAVNPEAGKALIEEWRDNHRHEAAAGPAADQAVLDRVDGLLAEVNDPDTAWLGEARLRERAVLANEAADLARRELGRLAGR